MSFREFVVALDEKYNACHNASDGRFCSVGTLAAGGPGVINVPRKSQEYRRAEAESAVEKLGSELISHYNLEENCKKWPPEVCTSLTSYTGYEYKLINKHLRGGKVSLWDIDDVKSKIKGMDEAFKRAPTVPENLIVKRGIPEEIFETLQVGTVFRDKGFVSTSIRPYAPMGEKDIEIRVPKGTKGIYVESISNHKNEKELLLNRDTKFRVIGFEEDQPIVEVVK